MRHPLVNTRLISALLLSLISGCSGSLDSTGDSITQPLLERYVLSSPDSVPEGIAFDPQQRAFYASSLQGGSITRIAADGGESVFREADGKAELLGLKVDPVARRLWACVNSLENSDYRVWVLDLDSGEQAMEYLLAAIASNAACNDLALDNSGAAYVTDPANPNIYRLDPASGEGEVFASDPAFADVTGAGLGLNGIAVTPDQSALVVAKFVPAQLFRVALPAASSIEVVALGGDTLPSPDGLVFLDKDLYSVSNNAVSKVLFNTAFDSGTVTVREQISGLSTATVAEQAVYVIKSDVTNHVLGLPLDLPFEIFELDLAGYSQAE